VPEDFDAIQVKLQKVLAELGTAKDSVTRRRLLVSMRELLAQADRLNTEPDAD